MAEVTWVTVGGRTSAVVVDAQPLRNFNKVTASKKKIQVRIISALHFRLKSINQQEKDSEDRDPESPLTELSETE
jgi:hypothetical protein